MSILESVAERRIVEAQRDGAFEGLRGKGQPLRLEEEDYVPNEWRAAFRLLKEAGLAPEWVLRGREIAAQLAAARRRWANSAGEADARRRYRGEIEIVNRQIDAFNLRVPYPSLQRPRVRVED